MGKDEWGPLAWPALHRAAIAYPENPSAAARERAARWFWAFVNSLPCPECRAHARAHAQKYPLALEGSQAYQTWAWQFHNAVNLRLGKPLMTQEGYRRTYAPDIAQAYAARDLP